MNLAISSVWMDWVIKISENSSCFSIVDIMFKVTIDSFIAMWKILEGFTLKCFKINVLTYSLNVFLVLNLNTNKVDFYNLFLTNEN